MKLKFTVNGKLRVLEVDPLKRLLDVLREDIHLKGAKEGCGEGECGTCAVLMDGKLVNSCMVSALRVHGSEILTIEGLGSSVVPDALQTAFVEEGAVQCGFCTPGMIIAARALLEKRQNPSLEEIKTAISGNLCRCTGYEKIYRAIDRAVKTGYSKELIPFSKTAKEVPVFNDEEINAFYSPRSLEEAMDVLKRRNPGLKIIAGGTDVFPDMHNNRLKIKSAMDISNIPELRTITYEGRHIKIGSCVTNTEIIENYMLGKNYPLLIQAASMCGAVAVQNMATIGGNIVTASGAADLVTALMALKAEVCIVSRTSQETTIPIEKFIVGHRSNILKEGELIKEILIETQLNKRYEAFYKRGSRRILTYSRVSLACCIEKFVDGRIYDARFALGSMSAIPFRLKNVERMLIGHRIDEKLANSAAKKAGASVEPRKESAYRKKVTENLVRKFILSGIE
ncbi:MAG: FAD binding domain-containing protein [Synergistaceae bacterium]|nr:FAD binding domain-containing protein [Synergistaceae bacterium]